MEETILQKIVRVKQARVEAEGPALGCTVPAERPASFGAPVEAGRNPFVITEIKRASPSRGAISAGLDPFRQASLYRDAGARTLSILTEEDHFSGSLTDLIMVKEVFPDFCLLRKDFLLSVKEVEISYRAGADMVLLIAAIPEPDLMERMYRRARTLGMQALVEVHTPEEVEKVRPFQPDLMGINSRNLKTFHTDLWHPFHIRRHIDWPARILFESGIEHPAQAAMLAREGWSGLLIGETAVRHPERLPGILAPFAQPRFGGGAAQGRESFWTALARRKAAAPGALVKICGLKWAEDAALAEELGADILGFVLAKSPRRITPEELRKIPRPQKGGALRVGVVQTGAQAQVPEEVRALIEDGVLDALQFHGEESAAALVRCDLPAYRALSLSRPEEAEALKALPFPRTLVDARAGDQRGGTGKRLSAEILQAVHARGPLWLAGGLNDENAGDAVRQWLPELVDASSGLEAEPGVKDAAKMKRYVEAVRSMEYKK